MKIYLAGPMRGIVQYNFPAFDRVKQALETVGNEVVSPADIDRQCGLHPETFPANHDWTQVPDGFDLDDCIRRDIEAILSCDAIYMLAGWRRSKGATAERAVAMWRGIEVLYELPADAVHPDGQADALGAGEVVTTSATGGKKGTKLARFDLLPPGPLWELAEHYGRGALKYEPHNYLRGYEWGKSYAACMRHLWQFWGGENVDRETGTKHVISAAWHCLCLAAFIDAHPNFDDRYATTTDNKGAC